MAPFYGLGSTSAITDTFYYFHQKNFLHLDILQLVQLYLTNLGSAVGCCKFAAHSFTIAGLPPRPRLVIWASKETKAGFYGYGSHLDFTTGNPLIYAGDAPESFSHATSRETDGSANVLVGPTDSKTKHMYFAKKKFAGWSKSSIT